MAFVDHHAQFCGTQMVVLLHPTCAWNSYQSSIVKMMAKRVILVGKSAVLGINNFRLFNNNIPRQIRECDTIESKS